MRVWCCGVGCGLWHRWCSGCCLCVWAGLLCAPVGGGPPARSPHASLRLGVIDLEARPGPAAAHGCRSQAPLFTGTAARPSGVLHTCGACVAYGCPSTRQHCDRLAPPLSNFARNSPVITSNIEFESLELQRFRVISKNDRRKLCATFSGVVIAVTLGVLRPGSVPRSPPVPSGSSGTLHTGGASCAVVLASPVSALRSVQNSPCLASWW